MIDIRLKRVVAVGGTLAMMMAMSACDSYVRETDNPISSIDDEQLNTEQQVQFQINGVGGTFGSAHQRLTMMVGVLSDELVFGGPGATYPQLVETDDGDISIQNPLVDETIVELGKMRLHADLLAERASTKITFTDPALKEKALFTGFFYGGVARYFWGSYFGMNPTQGGGVIDAGPFIPTSAMYDLAIEKLNKALEHTTDAYEIRVVNSLIARMHLIMGRYAEAQTAATAGMITDDAPWNSLYTTTETGGNQFWYYIAGRGRTQAIPDDRYAAYIATTPAESSRVLIEPSVDDPGVNIQARYTGLASPIPLITWQENELMLAECKLLGSGDAAGALAHVNAVRTSHGIPDLAETLTRDKLIEERDKELIFTGARLIDERRFNIWHLPAGTWQFLPITQRERDANDNF